MTFEEKLNRLEEIIERVENAQTPLEEAISLYKDGVKIAGECGENLRGYENEILLLKKEADELILESQVFS
ncbi:MAG: exodeoxyribonuclease VII small subunit [Defluviitaleaceae bacterium]|nr:exodeoxyribonuclease VII small subunit [Defluviitaleaceae bacterium]